MNTVATTWLARRRALVVGNMPAADAVAQALETAGAEVFRADGSVVELPAIAAVFDSAQNVDLLVHAGTPLPDKAAEQVSLPEWRATFSADIDGRALFAGEFVRRRLAVGATGNILFLMPSSQAKAHRTLALGAHGALDNLVKSLGAEWGRDGIRVNGIASVAVEDFNGATADVQASLCNMASYLLSDYAAYITGMVCGIDETDSTGPVL